MRGLREHGWVAGQNLVIDLRSSEGSFPALATLAAELARSSEVIITATTPPTRAALQATEKVPIVFAGVGDPVSLGFVKSLSHPERNATGVTNYGADLTGKRLNLLKEAVPAVERVAVMFHPDEPVAAIQRRDAGPAAQALGLHLNFIPLRGSVELPQAFESALKGNAHAIFRFSGQANVVGRGTAQLALQYRLPTMLLTAKDVEDGGLMSYWTDHAEHYRRAATYVDRILRGAKPADLPVEQPAKFELVVNQKTAKALGLRIPAPILLRADRVIE